MKKVLALALVLMLALSVASFASAEGQVISINLGGGTPLTLDPALNSASNGSNTIRNAFNGLMGYQWVDGVATLSPELAESYTLSEDGLTYSFVLREGLKWSDGTDLVASQIAASWNRAASAELAADYGFLFNVIDGFDAGKLNVETDDAARTVVVHLTNPCPYFLNLCAFTTFNIVRTDLADNEGAWATKPETYIGAGPFKMTKYAVDDVISFEKNPYYWNAANVKLDGINCYLSEDNVAILTSYENNVTSYIQSIESTEYARLNEQYPGELTFEPTIGTWYVLFNVHKDYSPAGKQLTVQEQSKARFALGQMINRYEVVTYVTQANQLPATGFFPEDLADGAGVVKHGDGNYGIWYEGTNTPSEINPDFTVDQVTAIQTLIDLGYAYTGSIEKGDIMFTDFPTIEFAFNNSGSNALIMQYVQETWARVGITGVINTEAWATLQQKLKAGDAESARMGWVADYDDVTNFLEIFISDSGNNYPRLGRTIGDYTRNSEVTKDAGVGAYWGLNGDQTWADAYDALVNQIKSTADMTERAKLSAEAEKVLMASGGVAPIYFYTIPQMVKPNVKGVMVLPTGFVIWNYAYLE